MSDGPDRSFDELASVVAHELVAPLTVIGSAASLLQDSDGDDLSDEELSEVTDTISRNVDLAQLVVEGLRRSDTDGTDVSLDRREVALTELTEAIVTDLDRTVLKEHPTTVEGPAGIRLVADPLRVRQVLFNLLSNAARYSPVGREIRVCIELRDDPELVHVVVRDRGKGVAPDSAQRIFGKWERDDDGSRGLGLGLHLSRAIARAHGGDLRLEPPEDGEGSIFVLDLPYDGATGDAAPAG